jgi:hypothetical protein
MRNRVAVRATLAIMLLVSGVVAEEAFKSGLQPGESLPGPFHPLNVTGESAGSKACLV